MSYQITLSENQQTINFLFEGSRDALTSLLDCLEESGRNLSLSSGKAAEEILLPVVFAPDSVEDFALHVPVEIPWLVWNRTGSKEVRDTAYERGALCVLPRSLAQAPLLSALNNATLVIGAIGSRRSTAVRFKRQFNRGERIHLEEDRVVKVHRGVVRSAFIHPDGSEVLIGFYGPGDVLIAHDAESCHVEMTAHTSLVAVYERWTEASRQPDFYQRLKERICQMERWTSMQARPVLEERLLGVLQVIAGKFSHKTEDGVVLDIKITHEQLATAIGATRTTVTRLLGNLRRAGKLGTAKTPNGEFIRLAAGMQLHAH